MFDSRYKSQPDESETAARRFIEENDNNEENDKEEVKSSNKEVKIGATYFSATYFGLMKKNKKEYKLKESD